MANKLFVGSLPWEAREEELQAAFEKVGKVVEARIVFDKQTGKSKGFGFVEMESEADAKKAIDQLNGSDMGGRKIFVSEARPQEPRNDR